MRNLDLRGVPFVEFAFARPRMEHTAFYVFAAIKFDQDGYYAFRGADG